jgi:hypothetical protein
MTRLDEPASAADRLFVAALTARAHDKDRRCVNCPPEGPCAQWWWALTEIAEQHRDLPST